jgi:hypothetical protein
MAPSSRALVPVSLLQSKLHLLPPLAVPPVERAIAVAICAPLDAFLQFRLISSAVTRLFIVTVIPFALPSSLGANPLISTPGTPFTLAVSKLGWKSTGQYELV